MICVECNKPVYISTLKEYYETYDRGKFPININNKDYHEDCFVKMYWKNKTENK